MQSCTVMGHSILATVRHVLLWKGELQWCGMYSIVIAQNAGVQVLIANDCQTMFAKKFTSLIISIWCGPSDGKGGDSTTLELDHDSCIVVNVSIHQLLGRRGYCGIDTCHFINIAWTAHVITWTHSFGWTLLWRVFHRLISRRTWCRNLVHKVVSMTFLCLQ